MTDIALGGLGKIVEVALKIKEAVETVKQNQKECRDIQRCVARVSALLKKLDETTEMMKDEAMHDALEDLAESLQRALELVTECQRKHIFRCILGAGDMAKELDRVQNDIVRKLQLGNFATNVQTTIMVMNIKSAGPPPPPPPPLRREIIDGFTMFSFSELMDATKDFSDENIIGGGGFGTVYKGILHDGQVVAIKHIRNNYFAYDKSEDSRLSAEINIFIDLKHKNVSRPLGYCYEVLKIVAKYEGKYVVADESNNRLYFVQEYMPAGTVESAIESGSVDWSSRFEMIQGIAQGLRYLHEQCVVHMDLKPSNILLDADMNPRIADFGIAKKLEHCDDEITCGNQFFGTLGYTDEEYISQGTLSTKCDVFAFGVTLLRTIAAMRISADRRPARVVEYSLQWAREAREAVRMEELLDPSFFDESQLVQIRRCMEIGLLCVEFNRKDRPTIADVIGMLNGETELPAPKKPAGVDDI